MKYKKESILVVCILLVCIFSIGYAAFSTTLKINGTGTISSTWNVHFDTGTTNTTCTVSSKDSGTPSTCTPTRAANTVTAAIKFASPGDVVTLKVRVLNEGSLNATHSLAAKLYLTSSTSTACTNVTATGNYTSYNASGTASNGTAVTLGTSNKTIGPVTVLNKTSNATYHYADYTFVFTYNSSATAAAGACTFIATGAATQTT